MAAQAGLVVKASVARTSATRRSTTLYFPARRQRFAAVRTGFHLVTEASGNGIRSGRFTFRGRGDRLQFENQRLDPLASDSQRLLDAEQRVQQVHSWRFELRGRLSVDLGRQWGIRFDGNWAKTRSINQGEPQSWGRPVDRKTAGLAIPEYTPSSVTGRLSWKRFTLLSQTQPLQRTLYHHRATIRGGSAY
ncbi:MAG: hypothetical protein ACLR8Y_01745 [Alistipes indistinctus]